MTPKVATMDKPSVPFFCTTRTMVGKTKFVSGKKIQLDIDECLEFFSKHIVNDKKSNSILQLRTGFKNAFTCDLYLPAYRKDISMKICKNGSFQFTGNITLACAYSAIQYVLSLLKRLYPLKYENDSCEIYIYEVMSNFVLNLNRNVDPTILLKFFESIAPNYSNYKCYKSQGCGTVTCKYSVDTNEIIHRNVSLYDESKLLAHVPYKHCVSGRQLSLDERKDYYITFLVFESGKVIVSGINEVIVERICKNFCEVLEIYFARHNVSEKPEMVKKIMKRTCYEKIVLIKIEDEQYVIVRGKSTYISSRKTKLSAKYSYCKVIYEKECLNINVFKEMKHMLKMENDIQFSNVVMTTSLDEAILLAYMEKCNI